MKKIIHITEEKLASTIMNSIKEEMYSVGITENSVQLNNYGTLNEMARINLGETDIFQFNHYAVRVLGEDHDPPHMHIQSKDGWDVCFYIENGEFYKIKAHGKNQQTFSHMCHNVKEWLSRESVRNKGKTNQENALIAWDEVHG